MFGKKGNVIAAVLIVVAILAGFVAYTQVVNKPSPHQEDPTKLMSESELAVQRALSQALSEFIQTGYSYDSGVWFCDYPFPPDLNESNSSLYTYLNKYLRLYTHHLESTGVDITDPDLAVDIISDQLKDLNNDSVTINLDKFLASSQTEDVIRSQELSKEYSFAFKIWLIYQNLQNWMDSGAGNITAEVVDLISEKQCQFRSCCCFRNDTFDVARYGDMGYIKSFDVTEHEVEVKIDDSLAELNQMFTGTGIECRREIERIHVENYPVFDYGLTTTCTYSCSTQNSSLNLSNMGEVKRWNEDITTPGVDSPSECGGGLDRPTRSYPDVYNPPGNYETIPEHENESASKYSYDLDSPYDLPTNYVAQFLFYTTPSVIESVAVDKGVAVLYSVVCEDPSVLIETEKGTETLKTKIQLRVSLKYDCVVPDTSEEEGNVTCNYWGPLPIPGPPAGTCPLDCPKCNMCVPKDPSNQFSTDPDDYECIAYAQGIETIFPEIPASLCPDNKCMTCDPATARPDPAGTGYDIMDCTLPYYGYQDKDCAKCEICIEDPTGACGSVDDAIALGQPAGVVSQIRTAINQISDTDCPGDCEGCDDDGSCGLGPPSIGAWDCGNACQTCTANNVCSVHSSQADNECDGTKCAKCGTDGSCGEYFNDGKRHNCPACNSCQGTADCVFDASMGGCGTCDMCDATVGGCAPNPAKLGDKCGSKECYEMRCANNGCTDKRVFEGKICGNNPQCRGRCDSSGDCDASANDGQSCDYCGENPDAGSCDNGYCKLDKLCCQGNICAGGSDTYKCCGPACYLKSKGACPDVT